MWPQNPQMDNYWRLVQNSGMGKGKKWNIEEMWQLALTWKKAGVTYRDIAGRMGQDEFMRKFGVEEAPSEDTVAREIKMLLASVGSPNLEIMFDAADAEYLGIKTLDDKPWQVACIRVRNNGGLLAKGCEVRLTLLTGATSTGSTGPFALNPIDVPYTLQRDSADPVDVLPGQHRSWDLAFAPAASGQPVVLTSGPVYNLHVPANVRGVPPAEMDWKKGGCCIGLPVAMTRRGAPQVHLLPGHYTAQVEITEQSGVKAAVTFRISSPSAGKKLKVELIV